MYSILTEIVATEIIPLAVLTLLQEYMYYMLIENFVCN